MVLKTLVFFRVDDSRVEEMVSEFGKTVSFEDFMRVNSLALRDFELDYIPVCLCKDGSSGAIRLLADDSYVFRELRL